MKLVLHLPGNGSTSIASFKATAVRLIKEHGLLLEIEKTTAKYPSITISRPGGGTIRYLALPEGPEEPPFRDALTADPDPGLIYRLADIEQAVDLQILIATGCSNCPWAVTAANRLAMASPMIDVTVIDIALSPESEKEYNVKAVPVTVIDRRLTLVGVVTVDDLIDRIMSRGTVDYEAAVLLSLVENGRMPEAVELLGSAGGGEAFGAAWRGSTTGSRIGLMLAAEEILETEPAALDNALPGLFDSLQGGDSAIRGDTADILGNIGNRSAMPALEALATDSDPDVAEAATEAIERLRR